MSRTKGTFSLTSNIEPKVGAPLDARTIVKLKTDLTVSGTFDYPYKGLTVFVEEENKKYTLIGLDPTVSSNWIEESASGAAADITYDNTTSQLQSTNVQDAIDELNAKPAGVQSDWTEDDTSDLSYIKNKPENLVQDANYVHTDNNYDDTSKGKVDALGTASTKDIPTSGDASTTQVVMGNDTRLSDARPASDVSSWAKASTKPTYTASEVGAIATTLKGAANGVAELDDAGKVPSSQLPSFVDDVIEVADYDHLPITGESGKIYVTLDTNKTYRWTGSGYAEISESLALGETSSTAYRGDRGKTAYDHATESGKISSAVTSGLYKVAATAQGHIAGLTAVTKDDITGLGIPAQDTTYDTTSSVTYNSTALVTSGGVYNDAVRYKDLGSRADYKRIVVGLCEISASASAGSANYFNGSVYMIRGNGSAQIREAKVIFQDLYAGARQCSYSMITNQENTSTAAVTGDGFRACVFTYNEKHYAGLEYYIASSHRVYYYGMYTNGFEPFMVIYYDANTTTIENSEIYNSITYSTDNCSRFNYTTDYAKNAGKVNNLTVQTAVPSNAVFTDTKVTQNNLGNTNTGARRIILSGSANDTTETAEVYKNTQLQFTPSTGKLATPKLDSKILTVTQTGTGTAAQDKGSGVSPRYFPAKWTFNLGYSPAEGDIVTITIPVAGHTNGVFVSIDNGTSYHPANASGTARLTTQYGVGVSIQLVFDADGTTNDMYALNGADARAAVTGGCWRVINYYDSNSNTIPSAYCETAAGTAAKAASCSAYALLDKSYVHVLIRYANTSASAITLNINSTGAKAIYINGAASSSSNYTLPAGTYLVYYASNIFYFRTDGKITGDITGNAETVNGKTVETNVPSGAVFTDSKVTQTATTTNANYEVLFSATADDTTRTEGARKTSTLRFNPSTGSLMEGNATVASGSYSHAEGQSTSATASRTHAEGYNTIASANQSHAEGSDTTASDNQAHAEGYQTLASGNASHSEGQATVASAQRSHAEGWLSSASGLASHAEGYQTSAYNDNTNVGSHAEGYGSVATGNVSHAEGFKSTASGAEAHSEGYQTVASGGISHAEGNISTALGDTSHAEGYGTYARGSQSHSEGYYTTASGHGSHAEGYATSAGTRGHAEGYASISYGNQSHAEGDHTSAMGGSSHTEGIYTSTRDAGGHAEGGYTIAYGTGSHAEGYYTTAQGAYSHSEGGYSSSTTIRGTKASGVNAHAEGFNTTASGKGSHAEGGHQDNSDNLPSGTLASGQNAHAEGLWTTASGSASHSEGAGWYNTSVEPPVLRPILANGNYAHAEGYATTATGQDSHAEGYATSVVGNHSHVEGQSSTAFGARSHAEGLYTYAVGNQSHAEGNGSRALELGAHAEGDSTTASGTYSHAEGAAVKAIGIRSHAEGSYTTAEGNGAHSEGGYTTSSTTSERGTLASGENSHSEGQRTTASGYCAHAEGYVTRSTADGTHSEGWGSSAGGNYSHAEGYNTTAEGIGSHAEGGYAASSSDRGTYALGENSHAEGLHTCATGSRAHSEGYFTVASGGAAHAEGNKSSATANNSHAECAETLASGNYSHAEGYQTTAQGSFAHAEGQKTSAVSTRAHAEGQQTTALGDATHAEGYYTYARAAYSHSEGTVTTAYGNSSHSEGTYTSSSGNYSHSEGFYVTSSGISSHAEGGYSTSATIRGTRASGNNSHAEGFNTTASGKGSHAEGGHHDNADGTPTGNLASGQNAHAEGFLVTASGNASHAEGSGSYDTGVTPAIIRMTLASGSASHAEGMSTTASNSASHAEGYRTSASAANTHAEGRQTTASGAQGHAEGYGSRATGDTSHAEGRSTTASGQYSHAEGYATSAYNTSTDCGSHAEGHSTRANGDSSHAEGKSTTASGQYSHSEGTASKASGFCSHAEGQATTASASISHAEGYTTSASNNYTHAEGYCTTADGSASHAEGSGVRASGEDSHAENTFTIASGTSAHAEGHSSVASGEASHAEGFYSTASQSSAHAEGGSTVASGYSSHAEGTTSTASGDYSHAEGQNTLAKGENSHTGGYGTTASNFASRALGHLNAAMTTGGAWNNTTGTAFVIGNGTGSTTLKNAFSVQFNGVVKAASTITASTTADYAEYFEWADKNPNAEDRIGYFVTFDSGDKIRFATSEDDYILGVTSGEPFVLGNGDCDVWNGMVLRDEFRRVIYEPAPDYIEVAGGGRILHRDKDGNPVYNGTRPKINPNYNPNQPYISRADRPEWCPVGMLGVLAVRDDGTCEVNGYATINNNAIATKFTGQSQNKYRVIRRNTQNVVEIVFR